MMDSASDNTTTDTSVRSFPAARWILFGIVLLGAALRFWGISWGVPDADVPHRPHHYDEYITVGTLQQINTSEGDYNPQGAHLGGTFIFFIWHAVAAALDVVGVLDYHPVGITSLADPNYGRTLIMGRAVITLFDLATIVVIYLVATRLTRDARAGLWAALFYAILPFQVIHCHFMRPHVAANLFVALALYLSLRILERPATARLFAVTGIVLGIAMATLYQLFALVMLPCLAFAYRRLFVEPERWTFKRVAGTLTNWRFFLMGGTAFAAFFAGCPFLFLDYDAARPYIQSQSNATDAAQFLWPLLFNLDKPLDYLVNALPTGLFLLVIPAYLSIIYMATRREYRGIVLPALVYSGLYFFYATKGYGLFAIRALLYLFPIFAVFSGVMIRDLLARWREQPRKLAATWAMIGFCFLPSTLYTVAYIRAMADREGDPYVQVQRFFRAVPAEQPLKVGFVGYEWDRYHVANFKDIIQSAGHQVEVTGSKLDYEQPENRVDYLLLFDFDSTMEERINERFESVVRGGNYRLVRTIEHPLALGPLRYDYRASPTDFRYPFPVIHLFAKK